MSVVDGAVPTHTAALVIGLLHPGAAARREITFALGALGEALGGPEVLGYSGLSLDGISMLAVRFASEPYVSDLYADIEELVRGLVFLAPIAGAVVAGLEAFYTHPLLPLQQVSIVAATALIVRHPHYFIETDRVRGVGAGPAGIASPMAGRHTDSAAAALASVSGDRAGARVGAVWNLVYRLDVEAPDPATASAVGARSVVCRSLELLAPVYCTADKALAKVVLASVLTMPDKSARETAAAKRCLCAVFKEHSGAPESARAALLEVFVRVISAQSECHYDILAFGLTECVRAFTADGSQQLPLLQGFVKQLMVHLRAAPDLVRWGAAVCLSALVPGRPALLAAMPNLLSYIVSGCLDSSLQIQLTYLHLLREVSPSPELAGLLDQYLGYRARTMGNFDTALSSGKATLTDDAQARRRVQARPGSARGSGSGSDESGSEGQGEGEGEGEGEGQGGRHPLAGGLRRVPLGPSDPAPSARGGAGGALLRRGGRVAAEDASDSDSDQGGALDEFGENILERPSLRRIVHLAVKFAPEPEPGELLAMLTTFAHIPDTRRQRQIDLIELWCSRASKVSPVFVQTFLPAFLGPGQTATTIEMALRVLEALCPALSTPSLGASVVESVDAYVKALLHRVLETRVFERLCRLIPKLPLGALPMPRLEELLSLLAGRITDPNPRVREAVYRALGNSRDAWRTKALLNKALGALLLCFGDSDPAALGRLVKSLRKYHSKCSASHSPLFSVSLEPIVAARTSLLASLEVLDALASAVAGSGLAEVRDMVQLLENDPDLALFPSSVRTLRDRGQAATSHHSHWTCLLGARVQAALYPGAITERLVQHFTLLRDMELTSPSAVVRKLGACTLRRCVLFKGQLQIEILSEATQMLADILFRDEASAAPAARRVPEAAAAPETGAPPGSEDPASREATAAPITEAAHWLRMQSAFLFFTLTLNLGAPGFGRFLARRLVPRAVIAMETEPSHAVKLAALEMVEAAMIVAPHSCSEHLERVRDATRLLFLFPHPQLARVTERVYPLLFMVAAGIPKLADAFHRYSLADLRPAVGDKWETDADPLLAKLSPAELRHVVVVAIRSMGALRVRYLALALLKEFAPFLTSSDRAYRSAALEATQSLLGVIPKHEAGKFIWTALPLVMDQDQPLRVLAHLVASGSDAEPLLLYRAKGIRKEKYDPLPPKYRYDLQEGSEPQDRPRDPPPTDPLAPDLYVSSNFGAFGGAAGDEGSRADAEDGGAEPDYLNPATLVKLPKLQVDAALLLEGEQRPSAHLGTPLHWTEGPAKVMVRPTVSAASLAMLRGMIEDMGPVMDLPRGEIFETAYRLAEYLKVPSLRGPALLVLSEFWKRALSLHGDFVDCRTAVESVIFNTSEPMNRINEADVHGSALALRNLALGSEAAFREALARLTSAAVPTQGELVVVRYLCDAIREHDTSAASALVRQYLPLLSAPRSSTEHDLGAALLDVLGELALIAGGEELNKVLASLGAFSGKNKRTELAKVIDTVIGRIIASVGRHHPEVEKLIQSMATSMQDRDESVRLLVLSQLKIFARFLSLNEMVGYCVRLLCDPSPEVREGTLEMILAGDHAVLVGQVKTTASTLRAAANRGRAGSLASVTGSKVGKETAPSPPGGGNEDSLKSGKGRSALRHGDGGGGGGGGGSLRQSLLRGVNSPQRAAVAAAAAAAAAGSGAAPGGLKDGPLALVDTGPLVVPMPELDYLNKLYLSSPHYARLVRFWGLKMNQGNLALANRNALSLQKQSSVFDLHRIVLADGQDSEHKEILQALLPNLTPLVSNIIRLTSDRAAPLIQSLTEYLADPQKRDQPDRGQFSHNMIVLTGIVVACDGLRNDLEEKQVMLYEFVEQQHQRCNDLRALLFADMDEMRYLSMVEAADIPTNQAQLESIMKQRRILEAASQDKDEREALLAQRRKLNETVERRSALLRDITYLVSVAIECLGSMYASITQHHNAIVSGIRGIMTLLDDEHRGIRNSVADTSVFLWDKFALSSAAMAAEAQTAAGALLQRLMDTKRGALRRKASDYCAVLARLLPVVDSKDVRAQTVEFLLAQFDSADSVLREHAVELIKFLCERGIPEALALLTSPAGTAGAAKSGYTAASSPYVTSAMGTTPSRLMQLISERLGDPMRADSHELWSSLNKWYFAFRSKG